MRVLICFCVLLLALPVMAQQANPGAESQNVLTQILKKSGALEYVRSIKPQYEKALSDIWADERRLSEEIVKLQQRLKELQAKGAEGGDAIRESDPRE